ncbi:MAG TPA: DUF1326 domain-containing protein [Ktedonobacterales bacterium]
MSAPQISWHIAGDYFENCSCDVVCPCLFSPNAPMTSRPTQGYCNVAFAFHIDQGQFGGTTLDGLNAAVTAHTPTAMADGNWSLAVYLDERADEAQRAGLTAIFSGGAGGVMAALAPLVGNVLGIKPAPITFTKDGKRRAVEIPNVIRMSVHAAPSMVPDQEIWAENAHPFAPKVAMAVADDCTWEDYGLRWDNTGKNGHYAHIDWSNA